MQRQGADTTHEKKTNKTNHTKKTATRYENLFVRTIVREVVREPSHSTSQSESSATTKKK